MDIESSLNLIGGLPSASAVGYLSPEIAGEGTKIIMSDGEAVAYAPPPAKPNIPDWSEFKSIKKYFHRTGYQVYPCWLYHPSEQPIMVKNADEASKFGVTFREATRDEKSRYGVRFTWDYADDSPWRAHPYTEKPNHHLERYSNVKAVVHRTATSAEDQHKLVEAIIPQVAAAVAQALKMTVPNAPPQVSQGDWEEFQKFKAWRQAAETTEAVVAENSDEGEKALWTAEAERVGVKVDRRWSVTRLIQEVDKASK